MKINFIRHLIIPLLLSLPIWSGCTKTNSTALAPEKISTAINQAFKQSTGEARELADNCAAAAQNQDVTRTFASLQKLSRRGDLTPEQRATAARALPTAFAQLRAAAERGNPAAKAVMHGYLSTR